MSVQLTFTESDRCVSIPISADALVEGDETFSAQLSTDDSSVTLSPQSTTITIVDVNSKFLSVPNSTSVATYVSTNVICMD